MAARLHRHQSSLEGIIDFCKAGPIFENDQQRSQAVSKFHRIVAFYENTEQQPASSRYGDGYNRPALIRLTFEYARSPESQDKFLEAFFQSLALEMLDDNDGEDASVRELFFGFADYLVHHFFLPLRAATGKTPQPTPTYHIAVHAWALRGTCLTRDRHRCVITRAFDTAVRTERSRQPPAKDDDGNILDPRDAYGHLEVAYILPFGLTKADEGSGLSESKKAAIAILNMFDVGVIHLIEGIDIDRPRNAITLSLDMTLFLYPSIDPPSERLLGLHSAIGHILYLSGAGEYINVILKNMEDGVVREDGSTQLGALVNAALLIRG
ncbi:hypothetical protein QBC36DRAFT_369302 [Triangularia setosa]|uniref:HNH nuclease domain-containing protein n=1 Tax=Triangularia setosa TaxID=2587417 RepID=A0AAN6VWD4_9PEZI|nr:hypothetical protein QBC36DRAFT_369302 [Podospora setosa]